MTCVASAAPSPFIRKMDRGKSGLGCFCSLTMKARSKTAAPASPPIVRTFPQPTSGDAYEGVDQKEHATGHGRSPERVEVGERCRSPVSSHNAEGASQENDAERKIDEEHPPPAKLLRQDTSEQHPHSRGDTSNGAPHSKRLQSVGSLAERRGENGECSRQHHRSAEPLSRRRAPISTPAVGARPPISDDRAKIEIPATRTRRRPSRSAETTPKEKEAAVGQQIAAQDPLEVLHREIQVVPDRGQRDVDD